MILVMLCVVWYVIGFASFVYWWTSKHDLEGEEMPLAVVSSFFGPINFLIGWRTMGDPLFNPDRVFFKKRQ